MSEVLADRFEVTELNRRKPPFGIDRLTGARVLVVETWPAGWPIATALDGAALRAMAQRVIAMDHPHVARVLSADPVVVEAGPERDAQPVLTQDEWIRIADDLAETIEALFERGVHPAHPTHAWVERRPDGHAEVRVPAPSGPPGLHYGDRRLPLRYELTAIAWWVEARADSAELGRKVGKRMKRRAAARDDRPLTPTLDFDLGIRLGEEELENVKLLVSQHPRRDEHLLAYATRPLAAAYHHRACVAWSRGDRELALRDVSRAIELDAHARYLTTAALWAEARGDFQAASRRHDRAIAAVQAPIEPLGDIVVIEDGLDWPERADRDATRTLVARAAFLARAGRYEEALADLEASVARKPTVSALVWLSSVRRKLGDREGAIEAADRALELDPASEVAARMRALA